MIQGIKRDVGEHESKRFRWEGYHDNDNFVILTVQNFISYSGQQKVVCWLEETESKFTQVKIVYNLLLKAISLLVEGVARCKYIKVLKDIRSFDDFYEFMLSQFEITFSSTSSIETSNN